MMRAPALGHRTTSKQCPLGLGEMTADFINAYVLRSAGSTGGMLGACATFLYNLERGVHAIRQGRARLVVVGYLALLHLLVWFSIHRLQSCVVARSCARSVSFLI